MGAAAVSGHPGIMPRLSHPAVQLAAALRPLRLLLVDDSPKVLAALRLVLADQEGLEVTATAGSAEEGLETALATRPDVVLLDVRMPGMGGLAAVPAFKRGAPLPLVVLLSLHEDITLRREAEWAGADGLLAKTDVDGDLLREVLEQLTQGRQGK
jgi:two-component system, NarL family, invasion response regulator UvrY